MPSSRFGFANLDYGHLGTSAAPGAANGMLSGGAMSGALGSADSRFDFANPPGQQQQQQQHVGRSVSQQQQQAAQASGENAEEETLESVLSALKLTAHLDMLRNEGMDLDAILICSDEDLKELGLPKGARLKLCKWIMDSKAAKTHKTNTKGPPSAQQTHKSQSQAQQKQQKAPKQKLSTQKQASRQHASHGNAIESAPSNYCCPISMCLMEDPVMCVGDRTTYERREIQAWFQKNNTSPMTNLVLDFPNRKLIPNMRLKNEIGAWARQNQGAGM